MGACSPPLSLCVYCTPSVCIAIRFPELFLGLEDQHAQWESGGGAYPPFPPLALRQWHVDGLRQGSRHSFSLLLGICCSKVSAEYCGNLVVWPGSHRLIHR